MDSETVHETARSGAGSVPDTGLLIWKSVDSGGTAEFGKNRTLS